MKTPICSLLSVIFLGALCAPAHAAVKVISLKPSVASPQRIGTSITWTAKAYDSTSGPLTFQFNIYPPHQPKSMVRDFNIGTPGKLWTSPAFTWVPTGLEGDYYIQVVAKDFASKEMSRTRVKFHLSPLVTGGMPVVVPTSNTLVALFSAPACPSGSKMRVSFQEQSAQRPATLTNWTNCHPPLTMTFQIAGMYPSTAYNMFAETQTESTSVNGPTVPFTTGALPAGVTFPPALKSIKGPGPNTDTNDGIVLHGYTALGGATHYPLLATDLTGGILWYYSPSPATNADIMTRPLQNGNFLVIQSAQAWNPNATQNQMLREVDLSGNVVKETNTGVIQQQLLALGVSDAGPCDTIASPAPVNSACLGGFHHDAIQTLPNGYTAAIADIEKIFPAGTQGDTSGMPVDIVGDVIIVMDADWQVKWAFDTFEHAGGGVQLDIKRRAVLGETCVVNQGGCPPMLLLGSGVAPTAMDWLHANSLYYWPASQNGTSAGDIIWSSRHQDWIMRINYQDGKGNGDILWRMGVSGDFTMNNTNGDVWPWFSHQHEAAMENEGAGPMTIFDNGNTRISRPGTSTGGLSGLGSKPSQCGPHDCNSRGMAVMFDENAKTVTPVLSQDLGVFGNAMGSAQLLSDGVYFYAATFVAMTLNDVNSYSIEIFPTPGTVNGTQVLDLESTEAYRGWQMPTMYDPPIS